MFTILLATNLTFEMTTYTIDVDSQFNALQLEIRNVMNEAVLFSECLVSKQITPELLEFE